MKWSRWCCFFFFNLISLRDKKVKYLKTDWRVARYKLLAEETGLHFFTSLSLSILICKLWLILYTFKILVKAKWKHIKALTRGPEILHITPKFPYLASLPLQELRLLQTVFIKLLRRPNEQKLTKYMVSIFIWIRLFVKGTCMVKTEPYIEYTWLGKRSFGHCKEHIRKRFKATNQAS